MLDHSYFLINVIEIFKTLFETYVWVVVVAVLISWINPDPHNFIVQFLRRITEPAINGLRRFVPNFLWSTGLDFTPLILIMLLQIAILLLTSIQMKLGA